MKQHLVQIPAARRSRLNRLFRNNPQRTLIVPLDHTLTDGPRTVHARTLNNLVGQLAVSGADAVVVHKGNVRFIDPTWFKQLSLILHLSASTAHAPDPDHKVLVGTVEEALRLGADLVSVHVNIGAREEARQLADMAAVAESCDRWNVPLLAMVYPRGPQIADPRDPATVAHAVTVAAELGADIVKTYYAGSSDAMRQVVSISPIPVVVAGGPRATNENDLLEFVDGALNSGVAGLAMGRNIFQSPDPGDLTRKLARRVHGDIVPAVPTELIAVR